jgi:hypothetical protein
VFSDVWFGQPKMAVLLLSKNQRPTQEPQTIAIFLRFRGASATAKKPYSPFLRLA